MKRLLPLLMLLILGACGQQPATKSFPRRVEPLSPPDMQSVMLNQALHCANGPCPEGIGRIFSINFSDHAQSSTCTAFLVKSDLVMTNSHCIFMKKVDLEKTCDSLYFAFPTSWGHAFTSRCSSILWRDPKQAGRDRYRKGENDFALIKLETEIPLKPLVLSANGMEKATMVYPTVGDFLDAHQTRIVRLECLVEKYTERSGIAQLYHCPIISGNSGSPVLNEQDEVVGIIFASSNAKVRKPDDELDERTRATSKGYAFSMVHVLKHIGHLLQD